MKKYAILTAMALGLTLTSSATVWRVNNQTGTDPDFTSVSTAMSSASVVNGDTIYLEPSATNYNSITVTKQLVFIGNGYLLDTAGASNGNGGMQENTHESSVSSYVFLNAGSEGSMFIGITFNSSLYFNTITSNANIVVEKCRFSSSNTLYAPGTKTFNNITMRKCWFSYSSGASIFNSASVTVNNLMVENCIFNNTYYYAQVSMTLNSASTNITFRNNTAPSFIGTNAYVANNIFFNSYGSTFNSCIVNNNLFVANQTGVTVGSLSTNGNNLVGQTLANIIVNTGSDDGKYKLAAASPALGGGEDIGGTKPDCGAFGGNDPYKLSGIPNIPSIYSLSFPNGNSIPAGSADIKVDFSTRNNN